MFNEHFNKSDHPEHIWNLFPPLVKGLVLPSDLPQWDDKDDDDVVVEDDNDDEDDDGIMMNMTMIMIMKMMTKMIIVNE